MYIYIHTLNDTFVMIVFKYIYVYIYQTIKTIKTSCICVKEKDKI